MGISVRRCLPARAASVVAVVAAVEMARGNGKDSCPVRAKTVVTGAEVIFYYGTVRVM